MHPMVPFVDIFGTAALCVTPGGIWFCKVISQGRFTVFGGVTDVCPVGVTVVLDFPPVGFVTVPILLFLVFAVGAATDSP